MNVQMKWRCQGLYVLITLQEFKEKQSNLTMENKDKHLKTIQSKTEENLVSFWNMADLYARYIEQRFSFVFVC